jgi:hypothetical protein
VASQCDTSNGLTNLTKLMWSFIDIDGFNRHKVVLARYSSHIHKLTLRSFVDANALDVPERVRERTGL